MTEAEWLACEQPGPMLEFLQGKASRKLRLFACACCRTAWSHIPEGIRQEAISVAEQHADGQVTDDELGKVVVALHRQRRKKSDIDRAVYEAVRCPRGIEYYSAGTVADKVARTVATSVAPNPSPTLWVYFEGDQRVEERPPPNKDRLNWDATLASHRRESALLLRDIFGNAFRPVAFDPNWRTSTAVALAQQLYDSRDFSAMPILADALQDAGCDNVDILDHCRGPGPHVRGCWVVDLLLDKK
jgi:hypothetical protein